MTNTHVITSNGDTHFEVSTARGPELMIGRALSSLDGDELFAVSLARLPEGRSLADRLPQDWPASFLQSAGTAERMTIEMRTARDGSDADAEHVVVGREAAGAPRPVVVRWPGGSQQVRDSEVFAAEEATRIYLHYYEHDTIPDGYVTRPLDGV